MRVTLLLTAIVVALLHQLSNPDSLLLSYLGDLFIWAMLSPFQLAGYYLALLVASIMLALVRVHLKR